MQQKQFQHVYADGSVITVKGTDIFDHVDTTIAHARAYTRLLSERDPNSPRVITNALSLNQQLVDEVCHLLEFMTAHALEKERQKQQDTQSDGLQCTH